MNKQEQKLLEKAVSQLLIENQKTKEKNLKLRRSAEVNLRAVKFDLDCEKSKNKKLELLIVENCVKRRKGCIHDRPDLCSNEVCNYLGARITKLREDESSESEKSSSDSD